jgi:hypothetical protein
MNRSYFAGCCVIVAAAFLGYWIFSDELSHRPPPPTLAPTQVTGEPAGEKPVVYGTRSTGDLIDLARVFEPTGQELDLHNLLHGKPVRELIPYPRYAEPELAPAPRESDRELLHAPRLALTELPDAGEEASAPTLALHGAFRWIAAGLIVEWLRGALPLKGSDLPSHHGRP